ncbi:gamma-interferon-responsive lysosomal thiol protein-like [Zingiber officinale]|uniref:gamma-interferon-responsive lysosomal thiol protein-like n=1 Tax=Zingiber officinale TaxID=94328 RepID=UPI001C4AFFFD|nr:gamma-interferon-responsive lysosomal thiol protein-like [Zingiber officinale]
MAFLRLSVLLFASLLGAVASRKVPLSVYYEAMCPFCSNFIVNRLPKLFESGLISAVDLELLPYGNARLDSNGSISCQHGQYECLLNTVEACAIRISPSVLEHFSFIYCVERSVKDGRYMNWEACFQKTGFDSKSVIDCYNSGCGIKLELQYKTKTEALQPPHLYVPWVVVNGKPLYEDYENFEHYICKAYGGAPPKACEGLLTISKNTISKEEEPFCLVEGRNSSSKTKRRHQKEDLHS